MKKKLRVIFMGSFCGLTIFQIAFFSNGESSNKIFEPIEQQIKYLLSPGIIICMVLPWSPDLYATYPGLLAFPLAVNSFLYGGLFVGVFLLVRKLQVQPRSL